MLTSLRYFVILYANETIPILKSISQNELIKSRSVWLSCNRLTSQISTRVYDI